MSALFDAIDAAVGNAAILDATGCIVVVNARWNRFALDQGGEIGALSPGINYLDVCDAAGGPWSEEAPLVAEGIRAVLTFRSASFSLKYPCHSPDTRRWFRMTATSLILGAKNFVITDHVLEHSEQVLH